MSSIYSPVIYIFMTSYSNKCLLVFLTLLILFEQGCRGLWNWMKSIYYYSNSYSIWSNIWSIDVHHFMSYSKSGLLKNYHINLKCLITIPEKEIYRFSTVSCAIKNDPKFYNRGISYLNNLIVVYISLKSYQSFK